MGYPEKGLNVAFSARAVGAARARRSGKGKGRMICQLPEQDKRRTGQRAAVPFRPAGNMLPSRHPGLHPQPSGSSMAKRPLLFLLGITGNLAFAAGCALRALRRHSPGLNCEVLIYTDGKLRPGDEELLHRLGARLEVYCPPPVKLPEDYARVFSPLSVARLEALRLLDDYRTVIWLDADIAVQGDLAPLAGYGPFSVAEECLHPEVAYRPAMSVNFHTPPPGIPDAPNLNAGILVANDALPDPRGLYDRCLGWLEEYAPCATFLDQAVVNRLARHLEQRDPALFRLLPAERFNTHPFHPAARLSALVHAYSQPKFWNSGLYLCIFAEWSRDYAAWLDMGGSAHEGGMEQAEVPTGGLPAHVRNLRQHVDKVLPALEKVIDGERREKEGLRAALKAEQAAGQRLAALLRRLEKR